MDLNSILSWVVAAAILGYMFLPTAIKVIENTKANIKKLKEVIK